MSRWEGLTQQVNELLKVRRLGTLVFARLVWQSTTPPGQLPPKLAQLLQTLSQWMQQAPDRLHLSRSADDRDVTLVIEFRPSATAVISHVRCAKDLSPEPSSGVEPACGFLPLSLDLFLLGTLGAVYLDGAQADWPHEPLTIPDLPPQHPVRQQLEKAWQ